jgi:uncharacterized Tic20 family protein
MLLPTGDMLAPFFDWDFRKKERLARRAATKDSMREAEEEGDFENEGEEEEEVVSLTKLLFIIMLLPTGDMLAPFFDWDFRNIRVMT